MTIPLVYALFIWWFTTGLVFLLVMRVGRATLLTGSAVLFLLALYGLVCSSGQTSVGAAYVAFTMAILVWGTQEVAFLTGALTGPQPLPCPPAARGMSRLRFALSAILYHEIGLIASGLAVLAATWHAPNQIGALTFLVLWVMRVSAKLNLFFGVPVLNDELLPKRLAFVRTYFRKAPATVFFPVSILSSVLALSLLIGSIADPGASDMAGTGDSLVAVLLTLAVVEHVFMLVPLPIARLWAWGSGKNARLGTSTVEPREDRPHELDRAAVTSL